MAEEPRPPRGNLRPMDTPRAPQDRPAFPEDAVVWLAGSTPRTVVVLGSGEIAAALEAAGHEVTCPPGRPDRLPQPDRSVDLVVAARSLPRDLKDVARVLRPGGVTAWNVSDGPPLRFVRAEAATLRAVFAHVALLAEPGTLRGRRFGNTVAVASDAELPIPALTRRCAGDPMPSRVVDGDELDRFVGQAAPVTDADAQPSPQPPAGIFD